MSASSLQLKAHALAWLRYGKRLPIVCTEVGRWNADVLGLSALQTVEVEVKTSMADLRREFKSKIAKHYLYAHAKDTSQVPNHFYFMVPSTIAEAAAKEVSEAAPAAGVASLNVDTTGRYDRDAVTVVKKAKKLREGPTPHIMLDMAMMRSSSELAGLYLYNVEFLRRLESRIEIDGSDVVRLAARAAGTLDCESPEDDLDLRAQELAQAVDGLDKLQFLALDKAEKKKWFDASVRLLEAHYVEGWLHGARL